MARVEFVFWLLQVCVCVLLVVWRGQNTQTHTRARAPLPPPPRFPSCSYIGNGQWFGQVVFTRSGDYSISVTLGGTAIAAGAPLSVTVGANVTAEEQCVVAGAALVNATAGNVETFRWGWRTAPGLPARLLLSLAVPACLPT